MQKNIDDEHYPASITKVMTALLAAENGDLETGRVTISQESVDFLEPGDAYIGMRPGEEISLTECAVRGTPGIGKRGVLRGCGKYRQYTFRNRNGI